MSKHLIAPASLCLSLSLSCSSPPPPAKDDAKPAPVNAEAEPAKTDTPTPATPVAPAAGCRALVNVSGASGYQVVDLKLGAPHQATVGAGLVARLDDGRSFVLNEISNSKSGKNSYGSSVLSWETLMMAPLPGGTYEVLHGETNPELAMPDMEVGADFEDNRHIEVVGIFGPYVSIETSAEGFGGGAHGFNDVSYLSLRLPEKSQTSLDFLGAEALEAAKAAVVRANNPRQAEGLDEIEAPKDLSNFGLAFTRGQSAEPAPPKEAALELRSVIFCCSWAENHNMFFLEAPLEKAPRDLERYFKLGSDAKARFEAPDGCGAVGYAEGKLWARLGKEGAPQPVTLPGGDPGALLGLSWIPASDPFSVEQLPKPPTAAASAGAKPFEKLSPAEEKAIAASHLKGSLAHPMFRGNFGPSPDTILVFSTSSASGPEELSGFALVPEGSGHRRIELPPFGAGQYNDKLAALLFDNLDGDEAREIIIVASYISGAGPTAGQSYQSNTVLDWNGSAFVELEEVAKKIRSLETAAEIRKALK